MGESAMKPVSVLLHELSAKDVAALPDGWSVLVYDTLYGTLSIRVKGAHALPQDKRRYVLLLYKLPPVSA